MADTVVNSTTSSSSSVSSASSASTKKTSSAKNELDKNAFLKILTAEMSNMSPDNAKDGTEYISQLAQFSSLEQMTNLNTTMTYTQTTGWIGKQVTMDKTDPLGKQYAGIVKSVSKNGDNITLSVDIMDSDGKTVKETKSFDYKNVVKVNQA